MQAIYYTRSYKSFTLSYESNRQHTNYRALVIQLDDAVDEKSARIQQKIRFKNL